MKKLNVSVTFEMKYDEVEDPVTPAKIAKTLKSIYTSTIPEDSGVYSAKISKLKITAEPVD